jgi:hypothetical protein
MTAREFHPAADNERTPARKLDVCLTPFGASLRGFSTGIHDLHIQIQPPQPRLHLLHRAGHTLYPDSRRLANSIRNT